MSANKDKPVKKIYITDVDDKIMDHFSLADYIDKNHHTISSKNFSSEIWQFEDEKKLQIKHKIEFNSKKLSKIDGVYIYRGVTTGYNPAFIIDEDIKNSLIKIDKKNSEVIKPLLQGRNIKKWCFRKCNWKTTRFGYLKYR